MKRFISIFLLCVILPFMLLSPLSSNALNVQVTEYPDPVFLPVDIDFSEYDYYFVTVSGTPDSPSYVLYIFKDNSKLGRLYFSVNFSSSRFYFNSHTAFDVTTDYSVKYSEFNSSKGTFNTFTSFTSSSSISRTTNFHFDGYSNFDSSISNNKYIIGCNADIYDYSGNLVRKGDYDNLISYFKGGLNGATDVSGSGSGGSGSGGSGGGGLSSGDLDFFANSFDGIFGALDAIAQSINAMSTALSTDIIKGALDEIKNYLANIPGDIAVNLETYFNSLLKQYIDNLETDLFDFKKAFLEFASVGGEIKNLAGLFSEVHVSISNLMKHLDDTIIKDFTEDLQTNLTTIRETSDSILAKLSKLDKLDSLIDLLNDISGKISDCWSELHDISYYAKWINNNITDYLGKIFDDIETISAVLNPYCVNVHNNILSILSELTDFHKTSTVYYGGMAETVVDIYNLIFDLPDKLSQLLKDLFIPDPDKHGFDKFIDEINEHFGFVSQIIELGDVLVNSSEYDYTMPSYSIKFDSDTYGHFSANIVDFSVVAPYVGIIKAINTGIILYFFLRRTRRKLPDIINGNGGD